MKLEWSFDMAAAPNGRPILLLMGETIPEMPDIRVGSFIAPDEVSALWSEDEVWPDGGWLIWNSADDWFVIGRDWPMAWSSAELPDMNGR